MSEHPLAKGAQALSASAVMLRESPRRGDMLQMPASRAEKIADLLDSIAVLLDEFAMALEGDDATRGAP